MYVFFLVAQGGRGLPLRWPPTPVLFSTRGPVGVNTDDDDSLCPQSNEPAPGPPMLATPPSGSVCFAVVFARHGVHSEKSTIFPCPRQPTPVFPAAPHVAYFIGKSRELTRASMPVSFPLFFYFSLLLQWENQVVEDLQSLSCVPRHYLFGKHGNKDVLVMELLSGEDMSALRCVGRRRFCLRRVVLLLSSLLTASTAVAVTVSSLPALVLLCDVARLVQRGRFRSGDLRRWGKSL